MGSGYGIQNAAKQRPTPNPADVGRMLLQQSMSSDQGMMSPGGAMPMADEEMGERPGQPDEAEQESGAGPAWPSADEDALRRAILAAAGKTTPQDARPPAPGNRAQLLRLGLTPKDVDLMSVTGQANAGGGTP